MPLLQGLIFDLDGTLLDSAPDLRRALNEMLRAHGRRELTADEVKSMIGDGLPPLLSRAFSATGEPAAPSEVRRHFQDFVRFYHETQPDPSQIYPHVEEMLKDFKTRGVKLGVCTNKQEAATLRLLNELHLTAYFDFIAGYDTFAQHKPHPDHVRGVIEKLNVPPESCVMIGDSPNDVLAAHGAGIPCLVITHGYGVGMENYGAESLIGNFKELPQALEKLGFDFIRRGVMPAG